MQLKLFKRHFRRKVQQRQRQVERLGDQAENWVERYFFRRVGALKPVRRFVAAWLLLCMLVIISLGVQLRVLGGYFQSIRPIPGGLYTEGLLGDFTNASPLYATSSVDQAVSRLIFAGLFKYDSRNHLVGDLAEGWTVDKTGRVYTVRLRPHLTWQDGAPLTSSDVAFTYRTIQNPDALSPLQSSWQGVTVTTAGPLEVVFTLKDPLSSFPYNLTNGIVPQHLLGSVPADEMRSIGFNTMHPIGAGPFEWQTVEVMGETPQTRQEQIALTPFRDYHGGAPKLSSYTIHAFHSQKQLIDSFRSGQLTAVGFSDPPPPAAWQGGNVERYNFTLTAATMVFFRMHSPVLGDVNIRRALIQGTDTGAIIRQLGYVTHPVREPLLEGQLGYNPIYAQASYDLPAAKALLRSDGWRTGAGGLRYKGGQPLKFSLYLQNTPENRAVAAMLSRQWSRLGAQPQLMDLSASDLQQALSQNTRPYDALLYGISIGVDPDVFVYWHSLQADPASPNRLNFSGYRSSAADTALEAGRSRVDPILRAIKYRPFLQAWQQDAPALGLYQPAYVYFTRGHVYGLEQHTVNTPADRYANVQDWEIRTAAVTDHQPT